MRVLLCQSYLGPENREPLVFPLGLAYLVSMLEDKHELRCFDPHVAENPLNEISSLLEDFNPDVVGVSFRNIDGVFSFNKSSYYLPFASFIKHIKKKAPSSKLVVGGAGFSIFPREIMVKNPEIDFGIISEGEYAFPKLLENLDRPERVKNLVFRKADKIVFTERGGFVDFANMPPPSREKFNIKMYSEKQAFMGIQSKRGCSFNCVYCLHRSYMGTTYRLRSPKKVVDEIEELVNEHEIHSFYFVDPVFNFPLDHAREICSEIIKRRLKIKWEAAFRPDFINARFMEKAVKAGCQLFDFSPDGASNEAMHILGKNFKVEHVDKTISLASKIENVHVAYEFVYDLPGNNATHVMGLLRLLPKIMLLCNVKLRYLTLTKMRIFPNTPLYRIAIKEGVINENTDLLFPTHYESQSSLGVAKILPQLLRKQALLFQKIIRNLRTV